jgi:hypothetical protein
MEVEQFFSERRYSPISDEFPCKIKYPKFYEAHKSEITIGPGDTIFIPAGWFHLVFSETDSEGVNFAINQWYEAKHLTEGESGEVKPFKAKHDLIIDPNSVMKPETELDVMTSPNGKFGSNSVASYKFEEGLNYIKMTWSEFWTQKRKDSYLVQCECPELDKYEKGRENFRGSTIWINFDKVNSYLHYDRDDNFLMQIRGTKRILLFPPEDHQLLYTFNPYPLSVVSMLDKSWNGWDKVYIIRDSNIRFVADELLNMLGDKESVPISHPDLEQEYINCSEKYVEKLRDWRPVNEAFSPNPEFVIVKSESVSKFKNFHKSINVIMFLNDSFFLVEQNEYPIRKGEVACFPNSWTYNWGIKNDAVVILAVAHQSTEQETCECPQ